MNILNIMNITVLKNNFNVHIIFCTFAVAFQDSVRAKFPDSAPSGSRFNDNNQQNGTFRFSLTLYITAELARTFTPTSKTRKILLVRAFLTSSVNGLFNDAL